MTASIERLPSAFTLGKDALGEEGLGQALRGVREAQRRLEALELQIQTELLPMRLSRVENWIGGLSDPEAPDIGRKFLEKLRATNCKTTVEPRLKCLAIYTSYSYADRNFGFANEIAFNPNRMDDPLAIANSIIHEGPHALQKFAAPALHYSPFNPASRIIVHPEDWVRLEMLCERDAFTKQALMNSLLAQIDPTLRERSKPDLVSVRDLEEHRAVAGNLQDALINAASVALEKDTFDPPSGITFVNHYLNVALDNFEAGMNQRTLKKETGHIFVRLEAPDFHAVGDYGVGPNSLGRDYIEPKFLEHPSYTDQDGARLQNIRAKFGIPTLEDCPTLSQMASRAITSEPRRTMAPLL